MTIPGLPPLALRQNSKCPEGAGKHSVHPSFLLLLLPAPRSQLGYSPDHTPPLCIELTMSQDGLETAQHKP